MQGGKRCRQIGFSAIGVLASACLIAIDPTLAAAADKEDKVVADIAEPVGMPPMTVQGVGLVVGLSGTGSDPKPTVFRQKLETEIRRVPGLSPDNVLADPLKRHSLVLVRATLVPGITPEDELNVEVVLPTGSETTSLAGGYLMETWLHEVRKIEGLGPTDGQRFAKAHGPLITDPENPKVGRILGGGRAKRSIPYIMAIDEKYRSGVVSQELENLVNHRFQYNEGPFQRGVAKAKTTSYLELNVPKQYHHNQLRYRQVISLLPLRLRSSPELMEEYVLEWGEELLDPETAGAAALKLEGLGPNAAPALVNALASPHPQVRFFAAEALAYLDNSDGSEELARVVLKQEEFRHLALAALGAMSQPAGVVRLRELTAVSDPEVRYGAFNALRLMHPYDPYIQKTRVLGLLKERDAADPMALKYGDEDQDDREGEEDEPVAEDPFDLYVLKTGGPPMVHVSRTRRSEVVLFGEGHQLLPPVVLGGTGPILLNAPTDDDRIEVSRVSLSGHEQLLYSSTDLVEVIRTVAALGGTYPQILSILEDANDQLNLTSAFAVDALSNEVEAYDRALMTGEDVTRDDALELVDAEMDGTRQSEKKRRFGLFRRFRPGSAKASDAPRDDQVIAAEFEAEPSEALESDLSKGDRPRGASLGKRLFRRGPDRPKKRSNEERPGLMKQLRQRLNRSNL